MVVILLLSPTRRRDFTFGDSSRPNRQARLKTGFALDIIMRGERSQHLKGLAAGHDQSS